MLKPKMTGRVITLLLFISRLQMHTLNSVETVGENIAILLLTVPSLPLLGNLPNEKVQNHMLTYLSPLSKSCGPYLATSLSDQPTLTSQEISSYHIYNIITRCWCLTDIESSTSHRMERNSRFRFQGETKSHDKK